MTRHAGAIGAGARGCASMTVNPRGAWHHQHHRAQSLAHVPLQLQRAAAKPGCSRASARVVAMVSPILNMVPVSVMSDSYKATHFLQYPGTNKMVAVSLCCVVPCMRTHLLTCRLPMLHYRLLVPACDSTGSSVVAMARTRRTHGWFRMASDTWWRTTCRGSGPCRTSTRRSASTGEASHQPASHLPSYASLTSPVAVMHCAARTWRQATPSSLSQGALQWGGCVHRHASDACGAVLVA